MVSVTQRIKQIKQPFGGYISTKKFKIIDLPIEKELNENENFHAGSIGSMVDYLTRYMLDPYHDFIKAFNISVQGVLILRQKGIFDHNPKWNVIEGETNLTDELIIEAWKMVTFDSVFRAGIANWKPYTILSEPDKNTIENVRIMVNRSLKFFDEFGPITSSGTTFEGAGSKIIDSGDADFTTKDTLWDFKVSRKPLTTIMTLQLAMYYLMGKRSMHDYLHNITKLGIFNPRFNRVYILEVSDIDESVLSTISKDVMGYE